ncbi:MAG: hypothetical protein QNJ53_10010 [Pleurocapsa sp. MO_192.B19]|nr:hypothetical protein [Pleurocapsa sp. MO_192.B19]
MLRKRDRSNPIPSFNDKSAIAITHCPTQLKLHQSPQLILVVFLVVILSQINLALALAIALSQAIEASSASTTFPSS